MYMHAHRGQRMALSSIHHQRMLVVVSEIGSHYISLAGPEIRASPASDVLALEVFTTMLALSVDLEISDSA